MPVRWLGGEGSEVRRPGYYYIVGKDIPIAGPFANYQAALHYDFGAEAPGDVRRTDPTPRYKTETRQFESPRGPSALGRSKCADLRTDSFANDNAVTIPEATNGLRHPQKSQTEPSESS